MECDVHLTADGFVVVAHDEHTLRMGSKVLDIEKSTLEKLRQITVSGSFGGEYSGEKIPLLSETFRYLGDDREYYIELKGKNPALIPAVKEVVLASGVAEKQIVFISFSGKLISLMKKAMPGCRALWLNSLDEHGHVADGDRLVAELESLGVDGIDSWNHPELNAELIRKVHDAGKIFAVWTVDVPDEAEKLIAMGVDSITSNRAAWLKEMFFEKK
jgi:glycerophosphoryl diester phosphodiesterase